MLSSTMPQAVANEHGYHMFNHAAWTLRAAARELG